MTLQRQFQTIAAAAFVLTGLSGSALAQQNTNGTNDQTSLHNQRLRGTSNMTGSTTEVTGRATNPNNGRDIVPNIVDAGSGTDQGNQGPFVTTSDKQFASIIAYGSMMEIELGTVASNQSTNPAIKQLGERMVDDYSKWANGMKKASAGLGIAMPFELDAKRKAIVDKIVAMSGTDFDNAYLKEVITLQNRALMITQHEAETAGVTGFRHWAGVMVPQIQEQLQMAKKALAGSAVVSKK